MSIHVFMIVFGIGAAILAIWADFRFSNLRPSSLYGAMLHIALAMLIARFIVPTGLILVGAVATPYGGVFLVGLPACVYCLLSCFWVMRKAGDQLGKASQGPGSGLGAK